MTWTEVLTVAAALGSAVMGGTFFAFSVFVMAALDRLPPGQAVVAMRAINVTVITPLFMLVFFGTALLSVGVLLVAAAGALNGPAGLAVAGALSYLVGTFGLTAAYNVPRNNRLERHGGSAAGVQYWPVYRREWTRANHVRTFAGIMAALLMTLAVLQG
jgi:uncharacterized membrane protein